MTLADLNNPRQIHQVFHIKGDCWIVKSSKQAWQEYPGSIELWYEDENGHLRRVQRWLKKSVLLFTAKKIKKKIILIKLDRYAPLPKEKTFKKKNDQRNP